MHVYILSAVSVPGGNAADGEGHEMKRETTNSRPAPATSETATHKPVGAGAGISTNGLRLMAAATRANRARLAVYQMELEAK